MPVKSVLTWVDRSEHAHGRLSSAIAVAARFDAHLSVAAVCFEPDIPVNVHVAVQALPEIDMFRERAETEAKALAMETSKRLDAEGVRGDVFPLVTTAGGLPARIGRRARYVDLVVLSQAEMTRPEMVARYVFEGALFDGIAAVLVCGEGANLKPQRVMIAWDGGPAAMRAVRRAHPFLADAEEFEIVLVDPSADQARSAEDLAVMLSRYGLTAGIVRVPADNRSDAEALAQHQVESGAEFAVMGAFGHSPFREIVLGGVTRDLPGLTHCPLLLVH